jgi:hypothetical protein
MTMRAIACLAVVLGLGFAPAPGESPAKKPEAGVPVEQWIARLGHREYRVRTEATKAITALGAAALPALHQARTLADAEVQRRLDDLIEHLERVTRLAPRPITLHVTNKPLKDVLAELAKQTKFKIPTGDPAFNTPQGKRTYTFHFDKVPFWKALDEVCEAANLLLQQQNGGDETIKVGFQDSYVPFRSYDGAFRVVATGFQYNRNTNIGQIPRRFYYPGQSGNESLQLMLLVAVEPRLPIMKVGQVKLLLAEDGENHSMCSNGNRPYYPWEFDYFYGGNRRAYCQQTNVGLTWPSKTSKTVKVIKGLVPVTLLADQKPTVVTDNLLGSKGKKFKVGTSEFHIEDVSPMAGGKQHQIRVAYNEEGGDNNWNWDYSRIQSVQGRIEVHDAKGNKYPAYVRSFQFNSPTSANFTITTQQNNNSKIGPPAKLMFVVWVQMEHEVAFEFHDLPLP